MNQSRQTQYIFYFLNDKCIPHVCLPQFVCVWGGTHVSVCALPCEFVNLPLLASVSCLNQSLNHESMQCHSVYQFHVNLCFVTKQLSCARAQAAHVYVRAHYTRTTYESAH